MGRIRRLTVIGAVVAAGLGASPALGAPATDTFQSPTGNIRCGYVDQTGVACYTRNNGRWAFLRSFGGASLSNPGIGFRGGRVLPYGSTWRRSTFRCYSSTAGMRCSSSFTGRGFFISRTRAFTF
jgi:hypothetical protein